MDRHPVRLVLRDDLQRSRLTVFFRVILAIPHFIWFWLWTILALVLAVANWVATLVLGRSPAGLHGALASYVRYSVHLDAYMTLATNPYPFFTGDTDGQMLTVEIDPPAPQRRWTVAIRIVLALPALLLTATLGSTGSSGVSRGVTYGVGAGGLSTTAAVLGWFASLATGRMPLGLRNAAAYTAAYQGQTLAYLLCLTDRYPYAGPEPGAPCSPATHRVPPPAAARLVLGPDDLHRSRLTVFFRPLLVLPHLVWLALWGVVAALAAVAAWVVALVTGSVPAPLHRFLASYARYGTHVNAFMYLVGGPFPGFAGTAGSYPVDADFDERAPLTRWKVLLRIVLVIPAAILGGGIGSVAATAGALLWLTGIVTGRAPHGLRNLAAYNVRYTLELSAFLLLLTDRYPYGGPEAGFAPADAGVGDAEPEHAPAPAPVWA